MADGSHGLVFGLIKRRESARGPSCPVEPSDVSGAGVSRSHLEIPRTDPPRRGRRRTTGRASTFRRAVIPSERYDT